MKKNNCEICNLKVTNPYLIADETLFSVLDLKPLCKNCFDKWISFEYDILNDLKTERRSKK